MSDRRRETRVLDATRAPDPEEGLGLPIDQSATWGLESAQEGAELSRATAPTRFYSRWGNPTVRRLETAVADLEGAEAALATASGMGAIASALFHVARGTDHIVAQRSLYTATTEILGRFFDDLGVTTAFVPGTDPEAFQEAITPETGVVYLETPSNPLLEISDIRAISEIARDDGVPVFVDNTFASPLNQRPLELGADLSLHSATKYLSGHSDVTGGVLCGSEDLVQDIWTTYKVLGPSLAPNDAFLIHRGLKTLALRIERHNQNALSLAERLADHPAIERVHYPGLKDHPGHEVAAAQMDGFGGMLSFEIAGGREAGRTVMESVEVCTLGVSLGGVETLIQHPASMTHAPLTPEELEAAGIPQGLIRLSVGVEHIEDLWDDLSSALDAA